MQIYCFETEGTPEWPSGTAITAFDHRTASSVILYRDLGPGPQPNRSRTAIPSQWSPTPGEAQAALELRRRANAILNTISPKPLSTDGTGTQPLRPQVELFTCGSFIGLAASDATAAAPALEKLRAQGLFRVAQAPLPPPPAPQAAVCLQCRQSRPLNAIGLCKVCASAPTKVSKPPRRSRLWLVLLLLIPLIAMAVYISSPRSEPQPARQSGTAPIVQFSANHQTVRRGSRVLLSWNTSGLSFVSISPNLGHVPASGKRWVVINHDTTFSLQGTGTGSIRPVTVTVRVVDAEAVQPPKPSPYSDSPQ